MPKKNKASSRPGKVSGDTARKRERAGTKASGGFVDERGPRKPAADKRRKTDAPPKERYRSGKMKEERPVYRGAAADIGDERPARQGEKGPGETKRAPKRTAAARPGSKGKPAPKKKKTMAKTASEDKRPKRS